MDSADIGRAGHGRPQVSVVMPTYGMQAHIADAIRDVQAQSFGDWELVVVDDASPDDSGKIARSFAHDDARIRVVSHESNQGLSASRNTGLSLARGRWVWIPDPDDRYDSSLLAAALAAAENSKTAPDAVLFGYVETFYDEAGAHLYDNDRPMRPGAFGHPDDWHRLVVDFERQTQYGYVWNKLYRLDRIRSLGLAFEPVRLIEDLVFNVAYFDGAQSLAVVGGTPYRYVKREGSSLTNANDYGASEYWALHERRVALLREQLLGWGTLGEGAPVLGSLYARFVISTLERSYHAVERWDGRRRRSWLARIRDTPLFRELVPVAQARDSRSLALAIRALRGGHDAAAVAIARTAYLARRNAYGLFTKARSGR